MKIKNTILLIVALISLDCTGDFEELNKDSLAPTEASIGNLFTGMIFEPINSHLNLQTNLTNQVMQYMMWRNDNQLDRYEFSAGNGVFTDFWQKHYKALRDYNDLVTAVGDNTVNNSYLQAGKILRAYYIASISEVWIDAPFSQASLGNTNLQPVYDDQQSIYTSVLKDLEDANDALSSDDSFTLGGDILFGGDVTKWKKFANSLRLRYLLRLSDKVSSAKADFEEILSDSDKYPIMESNSDGAVYNFGAAAPNVSDFSQISTSRIDGINTTQRFVALTDGADDTNNNSDDDPRLAYFVRLPDCNNSVPSLQAKKDEGKTLTTAEEDLLSKCKAEYLGNESGVSREIAQGIGGNAELYSSNISTRFQSNPDLLDYVMMSFTELQFVLSEATLKGWTTPSSAKDYYEAGITANFSQWNITMPTGFLSRSDVVWNNTLAKLIDQKWLAMYWNNTLEMWATHKRTGLPALVLGDVATSNGGGKVATRAFYPTLEQSVNSANYNSASSKFGSTSAEKITAKHWYQN